MSVLATHLGQGADTKILKAGDERAVSDTTFVRSSEPSARSAWAASSKFADLSWADVGAKTYTVYRDGAQIGTTSKPSFRDTGVTPGTEADYRIIGAGKKDTHTWGMTATIPSSDTTKALNATAKDIEAKARKYSKSTLRWRSFIRPTWANIPKELAKLSGCKYTKGYKYAGDARGFWRGASGQDEGEENSREEARSGPHPTPSPCAQGEGHLSLAHRGGRGQ